MKVSVVIPSYGRPELAARAAASAAAQHLPKGLTKEVILVDDGGKDGTRQAVRRVKGLKYFWQEHAGPAAARNHGARRASGEVIAFLDSDTVAQPGWLAAGSSVLNRRKGLFGVEGRVLPESEQEATPFTEIVENRKGGRWLTCNLFVRRKEFLALGGFDERFKRPVREDSEFAFRALEAGKTFAFEPKALVLHPVREVAASRFFFHAREGMYEALVRKAHPESYRRHFKWMDGRAVPVYYWGHYAAPLLFPASRTAAALALGLGTAAVLAAWCRKRRVSLYDPFRLLIPALSTPYLRLFWVLRGEIRHPQSPE